MQKKEVRNPHQYTIDERDENLPPKLKYRSLRDEYEACQKKKAEQEIQSHKVTRHKKNNQVVNTAVWGMIFMIISFIMILMSMLIMLMGMPYKNQWIPHILLYFLAVLMSSIGYLEYRKSNQQQKKRAHLVLIFVIFLMGIGAMILFAGQVITAPTIIS